MQIPAIWPEDENGNRYGICSMAKLIFLSNGQSVEDRLTGDITLNGDVNYSTEEQLTGKRWTDGKPIYQKTVQIQILSENTWYYYTFDENIDIIKFEGVIKKDNDGAGYIPISYSRMDGVLATAMYWIETNQLGVIVTYSSLIGIANITIQYTKTTDTANSPIKTMQLKPMLNYSTEEQIIGKWIDGKPLYQKTIIVENESGFARKQKVYENTEINILSAEKIMIFVSSEGQWISERYIIYPIGIDWNANNVVLRYNDAGYDGMVTKIRFTIQYTKIADTTTLYISPDANNYTLDEKVIGTWIDGKPIYEKVINMGYLPNSSSINIDVSELNIDNIIELRGMCYTDDKKNIRPITLGTSDTNAIRIDVTNNTIRIFTWSDWSAYNSFCIIQYTKTTD